MLSRPQQILLKRAQREAALSEDDYRDALQMITGCRSGTAPKFMDRHPDKVLAYFEAIYWCAMDAGRLQPFCSTSAVFRRRGYWAAKNARQETSQNRFTGFNLRGEIAALEEKLAALGYGAPYCVGIRSNVARECEDEHALHLYHAALSRTLNSKAKRQERALMPD
jgi:hypothetical protein